MFRKLTRYICFAVISCLMLLAVGYGNENRWNNNVIAAAETIAVQEDGTVIADSTYSGPQIKKTRVLKEGNFMEIYWDRYVDEIEAVDISNFVLKNGTKVITIQAKAEDYTNTLYFDKKNKAIASSDGHCMDNLPEDCHMSSICFDGNIDVSQPLTLEVKGSSILDVSNQSAKSMIYTGVPYTNYYTQYLTTETGIVVKADASVSKDSLEAAKQQIDVMLSKEGTGMKETLAQNNASLAIYSAKENVYFIPEHRYYFSSSMYDVEGYGGSLWNNCVSSIAERNIIRTLNSENEAENTMYRNENILIHEFGHCVKSVGIEEQTDKTLYNELKALYQSRKNAGMWPNTYAISNEDEFFATLCTIWFGIMSEAPSWNDGVRSPINTREELKQYDPEAYAFFAKILPERTLPAPWTPTSIPDQYHDKSYVTPSPTEETPTPVPSPITTSTPTPAEVPTSTTTTSPVPASTKTPSSIVETSPTPTLTGSKSDASAGVTWLKLNGKKVSTKKASTKKVTYKNSVTMSFTANTVKNKVLYYNGKKITWPKTNQVTKNGIYKVVIRYNNDTNSTVTFRVKQKLPTRPSVTKLTEEVIRGKTPKYTDYVEVVVGNKSYKAIVNSKRVFTWRIKKDEKGKKIVLYTIDKNKNRSKIYKLK